MSDAICPLKNTVLIFNYSVSFVPVGLFFQNVDKVRYEVAHLLTLLLNDETAKFDVRYGFLNCYYYYYYCYYYYCYY